MNKLLLICIAIITHVVTATADEDEQQPQVIRLWSIDQIGGEQNKLKQDSKNRGGGKISYYNVKDPNLTFYPAQSKTPSPAVIYCPGGGYQRISVIEPHIKWLNSIGYSVYVLKYTVPNNRDAAYRDLQRSMRLIRYNARLWNINPNKIGVMGGSAGGHLVARLSQNYPTPAYTAIDEADKQSCEPDFVIILSGAYFATKKGGSILAKHHFHMKNKIAPTLLVYAEDDKSFVNGGITYKNTLTTSGINAHILLYPKGGHELKGVKWYPDCEKWLQLLDNKNLK